jgi:hypothetical protein
MLEAESKSETLVNFYQTTRRYNPDDSHLHIVQLPILDIGYTFLENFYFINEVGEKRARQYNFYYFACFTK